MRPLKPHLTAVFGSTAIVVVSGSLAVLGSGTIATSSAGATVRMDGGVSTESPTQVLAAAQTALRSVHGFVLTGNMMQSGRTLHLRVIEQSSSRFDLQLSEGGRSADLRVLPGAAYLRANRAYWKAVGGSSAAQRLGGQWVVIPVKVIRQLTSALGSFAPMTLSKCLGEDRGVLSRAGTTTINGQSAVVIQDAGNVPGGNPGAFAVAATGTPYLLQVTVTGPTRAGGKIDQCNDGKGGGGQGSLTLSDFNNTPALVAPKLPIRRIASTARMRAHRRELPIGQTWRIVRDELGA